MKIKYLGTAAAEGIPALFCHCKTCEQARKNGGKDFRTRSQSVIDNELLIDFPADTYMHVLQHGLPLHKIKHCIITHSHEDHLYPADLGMRAPAFAPDLGEDSEPLHIYGSNAIKKASAHTMFYYNLNNVVEFHLIQPFTEYDIGGYKVVPMTALHDKLSGPYIYIISKGGKSLLYANDTGYFTDDTWEYLEKNPVKFDYVSLDCTAGVGPIDYDSHMNFEQNIAVKNRLLEIGCAGKDTVFCINHFSHNGGKILHEELSREAAKEGFLTSFDGMEYEF
ncbi:MAG: hypothetical protein J6C82_04775 [Clostridia bacterium]|nr:hypothetical protein [Clostridia bacterium]